MSKNTHFNRSAREAVLALRGDLFLSIRAIIGVWQSHIVCRLARVSLARKVNYHGTSGGHFDVGVASPRVGLKGLGQPA